MEKEKTQVISPHPCPAKFKNLCQFHASVPMTKILLFLGTRDSHYEGILRS